MDYASIGMWLFFSIMLLLMFGVIPLPGELCPKRPWYRPLERCDHKGYQGKYCGFGWECSKCGKSGHTFY